MNTIYLLRHCEYDNPRNILPGRLPVKLSVNGRKRARRLHKYFLDKKIGRIYSSAVLRCKQTSEAVSGGDIPITYDKRILETFSAYQGYWVDDPKVNWIEFFSHHEELGGENLKEIQKRMGEFWDELVDSLTENVIICSHGDPLQTLYAYINQLPLVADEASAEDIPGWLQKGEFIEIEWGGVKDFKVSKPVHV